MPSDVMEEPLVLRFRKRCRGGSLELPSEDSLPAGLVIHEKSGVASEPHRKRTRVFRKVSAVPSSLAAPSSNVLDVDLEEKSASRRSTKRRFSDVSTSSQDGEDEDTVACYYVEEAANYSGAPVADAVDLSEWWADIMASRRGDASQAAAEEGSSVKLSSELLLGRRTMNLSASDGAMPSEQDSVDLSPVLKAPTVGYVPASEVEGLGGIAQAFRAYTSHVTYQTEEDDWEEIERKYLS
ncbi:hypothetical protein FOL47_005363 [Perkinsus chesapeaki]|uniref:Uncharacterized protein n=1 Tax=Perkinsus chesapeaki TaxID=330153 RepID=A0A7J6N353_PERCH|nr:hypothetical protein FOL47_005363 [Perkinsus chesapeaki]